MSKTRVLAHSGHALSTTEERRVQRLALEYQRKFPDLQLEDMFRHLRAVDQAPQHTLHLDDSSAITGMKYFPENVYLQDRARWRAGDDDVLVTCSEPCAAFESYCSSRLALGRPLWIRARPLGDPLKLASACWTDRDTRGRLVFLARQGQLERIHPYLGSFHVWALGALLCKASDRPLSVLAPPPGLARRVNEKTWFARLVRQLLGEEAIPESYEAFNYTSLARVIQAYLKHAPHIIVKLPDSAGGKGNLLLNPDELPKSSIGRLRASLREQLQPLRWTGNSALLVSSWEDPVLSSPSAQLWLPPLESGEPVIIEGFYNQQLAGSSCEFMGSEPADFPARVEQKMARSCTMLGRVLQQLGYVGRCSFDMLLTGERLAHCRLEFIECNGRWGGTSGPMSLMNRWYGDWAERPYATHNIHLPGLEQLSFTDLLRSFHEVLFDATRQTGWLAFMDASGLNQGRLQVLAMGRDVAQARERASGWVPARLQKLVNGRGAQSPGRIEYLSSIGDSAGAAVL